jgi:hypothetical protein
MPHIGLARALSAVLLSAVFVGLVAFEFSRQATAETRSAQAGDVTISIAAASTPIANVFVSLTGLAGQYAGVTNSSGQVTLASAADGSYTVAAAAPGYQVGSASITVAGAAATSSIALTSSGTRFSGLGADGGQVGTVVADGKTGVFYANTTAIPSLYRTADHGGSWVPITVQSDDSDDGFDGRMTASNPTTSGFPGEIAAAAGSKVWYSRDFGVSWRSFNAPTFANPQLLWSHVGNTSILFAVDSTSTSIAYATMPTFVAPTLTPSFTTMSSSYKTAAGDRVWVGSGSSAPVIAVAAATGSNVRIYSASAAPNATTDAQKTIAGAAPGGVPVFVRIGGPTTGDSLSANTTPNTLLVYSNDSTGSAVMSTYASGAWTSTTSTTFRDDADAISASGGFNSGPSSCGGQPGAIGSIAPTGGRGTVAQCWVTQSGTALTGRMVGGINNNTGVAFDAGYDGTTNLVLLSGDGNYGLRKSTAVASNNRPSIPGWPTMASAGTGAGTGGIAVSGMTAAVVKDTDFGPTRNDIAVILSFTGGSRVIGSPDAGATWYTLHERGGNAVSWWRSATSGDTWILSAVTGAGNLLNARRITSAGISATTTLSTVIGTANTDLGLTSSGELADVPAIVGMPGTDAAWLAATDGSVSTLRKVTLSGSTSPTGVISAAPPASGGFAAAALATIAKPVAAVGYCPTTGSASSVADVLIAVTRASTDGGSDGLIVKVTGAATGSPTQTTLSGVSGDFRDVRLHCTNGIIYASRAGSQTTPPLVKSTDGGTTFTNVTIASGAQLSAGLASNLNTIETFAINESDANEIVVVSRSGDIATSKDGGLTWIGQNDTSQTTQKSFGGEKPGDIMLPPGSTVVATTSTATPAASGTPAGTPVSTVIPGTPGSTPVNTPFPTATKATLAVERSAQASVGGSNALLGSGAGLFSANVRGTSDVGATATPTTTGSTSYKGYLPIAPRNVSGW